MGSGARSADSTRGARAALDAEEGRGLLTALRAAVHAHLGYATFAEYVERLFGYSARSTQEKLGVAEALEELPATAAALEHGEPSWSAVRELTRVAVPDTEQAWLTVARGKTVHQLEALVAGKKRGATPDSVPDPDARRHVLRFEVGAETFAVFREAIDSVRRDSGGRLDDDSASMEMARHVLGGPTDEGRASYQIALSVCRRAARAIKRAWESSYPSGRTSSRSRNATHSTWTWRRWTGRPVQPRARARPPPTRTPMTPATPLTPTWAQWTPTRPKPTPTWAPTRFARLAPSRASHQPSAAPSCAGIIIGAGRPGVGITSSWTSTTFGSAPRGAPFTPSTS